MYCRSICVYTMYFLYTYFYFCGSYEPLSLKIIGSVMKITRRDFRILVCLCHKHDKHSCTMFFISSFQLLQEYIERKEVEYSFLDFYESNEFWSWDPDLFLLTVNTTIYAHWFCQSLPLLIRDWDCCWQEFIGI